MALILRVDIDKPYGNSNVFTKVASKVREDYWLPKLSFIYLYHFKNFLRYCNQENISGFMYHRICTIPDKESQALLKQGKHKVGMHAENTRSEQSFANELKTFAGLCSFTNIESFSKHGSGEVKLGRYHYAKYEPEKYSEWAKKNNIAFYFGNGIAKNSKDLMPIDGFYPNVFWIERDYRDVNLNSIEQIIEIAKQQDVPVLIHPCNYQRSSIVKNDFIELVELAKKNNISWKIF